MVSKSDARQVGDNCRMDLSPKKSLHAPEQTRPDVAQGRQDWHAEQLDAVLID